LPVQREICQRFRPPLAEVVELDDVVGLAIAGHLKTLTAPSGAALTYADDGPLPLEQAPTGEVAGRINQAYDSEQRLASETVNGAHAVSYGYDADDLLTSVGALTITRDPVVGGVAQKNGLVAATTLGSIGETRTYNAFGEPASRVFTAGAASPDCP
jgi:YD repeat-containing protein